MILFPIYGAIVLYAVYRLRRRFLGAAVLAASLFGLALLAWVDYSLGVWFTGRPPGVLFRLMLVVEAALLFPLGGYLWTVRRERIEVPCRACGYELLGLESSNPTCPECGLPCAAKVMPTPETITAVNATPAPSWDTPPRVVPAAA